jgi:hypothetical protein
MHLPAPSIEFTPLATLLGVPTPAYSRTEENETEERPGEASLNDREVTPPTHAQGGGTGNTFGRSEQNDESEASEASLCRPLLGPGHLCSDRPNTILPTSAGTENMEPDRGEIPHHGCSEVVPALRMPSPP